MNPRALLLCVAFAGCEGEPTCRENPGAQVLEERVELTVAGQSVSAELADEDVERERGWRKRACDREALLLVPSAREPLPVWGCELLDPIDVLGLRDGVVVQAQVLDPCGPPCGGCPIVGQEVSVDAVLEVPQGTLDADLGDPVTWMP